MARRSPSVGPFTIAALTVLALVAIVVVYHVATLPSHQMTVQPAPAIAIDPAAAERLAGAIRIPTVSSQYGGASPDALAQLHLHLAQSFPRTHRALNRDVLGGSLLYEWRGQDPSLPPLLLLAHLDVVPAEAGTDSHWSEPPFSGVIKDGFVWGRGAMDMKMAVTGLLEATETLLGEGFAPRRTVWLAFGHDEEIGGAAGAQAMAEELTRRHVAPLLVLDEGLAILTDMVPGLTAPVAAVGIAEKGYLTVNLIAEAAGGHTSMPPHETAAGILASAIKAVERDPPPRHLEGPVSALFEFVAPEMRWGPRLILSNLWLTAPLVEWQLERSPPTSAMLRTTIAVTMLQGSSKENVLPTRAVATLNIRIHPAERIESVLEHLGRVVEDPRVRIERAGATVREPSALSAIDGEPFALLQRTIHESYPDVVVAPGLVLGATDSRHYAGLSGALYRFSPVRISRADTVRIHGADERIAVKDYTDAIRFYARLIRNAAGPL